MAGTKGGHEQAGICGHHTLPVTAGYKGTSSREQARIELGQGIPIEVIAGLGKGAIRDTAHMSETSPIISAQACKEAVAHDLL